MAFRKKTLGLIERIVSTASSGGNLALANNSRTYQQITGTLAHTVTLPQANAASPNECPVGLQFTVLNRSTGVVTVNFFGGALAKSMTANIQATFRLVDNSTSAGVWDVTNEAAGSAGNSLTSEQKAAALAGLSNTYFQDANTTSNVLNVDPEEIGGNYWQVRTSLAAAKAHMSAMSLNGYAYGISGRDNGGTPQNTVERYSDDSNYWLPRTAVNTARSTALSAGLVKGYMCGGFTAGGTTSAVVEAYDDVANTWTTLASLPNPLQEPFGGFLNGSLYIAAGFTSQAGPVTTTASQVYSVVANAWYSRMALVTGRAGGASLVDAGKGLYVCGGSTGSIISSVEIYNDSANYWTVGPAIPEVKHYAANAVGYGVGHMLSGRNASSAVTTGYRLNFDTKNWTSVAPSPNARGDASNAGAAINGVVLAIGGDISGAATAIVDSYVGFSFYNIVNKKSSAVPSTLYVAAALNNITGSVPARMRTDGDSWKYFESNKDSILKVAQSVSKKFLESGALFAAGGDANDGATFYSASEFYNPVANTWTARASFSTPKAYLQAFKLSGYGHLVGGQNPGGTAFTDNERYNELTNVWDTKAVLPVAKTSGIGFNLGGYGYAVTGGNGGGIVLTNYRYDPDADSWSTKTAIPSGAAQPGGYVILDRAYVVNGSSTGSLGNNQNLNQQYNDITDAWTAKTGSTFGRTGPAAYSLNGYGFLASGFYAGNFNNTETERYDQALNTWSALANLPVSYTSRGGASSAGAGYAIGGRSAGATPNGVVHKFNPESSTYSTVASLNTSRSASSSNFNPGPYRNYELQIGVPSYLTAFGNGAWVSKGSLPAVHSLGNGYSLQDKGWTLGGDNNVTGATTISYQYDPTSNSSIQKFPLGTARQRAANFVIGGLGYIAGGQTAAFGDISTSEVMNPETGSVSIASLGTARGMQAGGSLNGYGYSIGGNTGGSDISTNDQYNPSTNAWTNKTALPIAKAYLMNCGQSLNGFIYVASGYTQSGGVPQSGTHRYDDAANTWLAVASLNTARYTAALANPPGALWIFGGGTPTVLDTAEEYRDAPNIWIARGATTFFRTGAMPFVLGNNAYFAGGNNGGTYFSTVVQRAESIKNIVLGAGLRIN